MNEQQRVEIVKAVEEAMRAFEAAERALDAERLIAHFSGGADHYIYNDGQRVTHEALAAGVRGAFPTLQSMQGGFGDLDVMVLAPDAALVAATFEETVTTSTGERMQQRGVAPWLWRHVGGGWRIVYGHVDHYPDASSRQRCCSTPSHPLCERKDSRVSGLMLRRSGPTGPCRADGRGTRLVPRSSASASRMLGRRPEVNALSTPPSAAKPCECLLRSFPYMHLRIVEHGGDAVANR
jgi:ketosteroid isomerase-like protein